MMIVELEFDVPAAPERLAGRAAHRELLGRLREEGRLLMAGPWTDDAGALLVFDVDRAELDRIMAADPYYALPGVRMAAVREWRPVVGC
ncbi:YciI family protein [Streptomyces litchfieldiae]|uniref:YciI family protein n=1 Tax=Streptomyces litchfieldiae TaxID=3075543 RepID=A0ABU2ML73_9ACTN|nr:YciI family protein [Streptomyces sp. DSM 44938]MDT0342177.1 YciI family protein [Streptomyces sp. DSM 44938]